MVLLSDQFDILSPYFEHSKFNYPITDSEFKKVDGSIDSEKLNLSKSLKAYILCHCDYTMDTVLQAESTEQGFELWRRLRERYDQVTDMSAMGRLTLILSMKFEEENLEDNLSTWDSEVSKYHLWTNSILPDPILFGIVSNGTTGHLQQLIQLHSSSSKDYKARRDSVVPSNLEGSRQELLRLPRLQCL